MQTKTKIALLGSSMLFAPPGLPGLLRGPMIARAPEDDTVGGGGGDDLHEDFQEQEGDREGGDAGGDDPPDEEGEEDGDADPDGDAEGGDESGEEGGEGEPDPDDEGGDEGGEGEEGDEGPKPKTDWRSKHLAKVRARAQAAEQALEAEKARVRALEALVATPEGERGEAALEPVRQQARQEAIQQVRQEQYFENLNKGAEKLFEDGKTKFPKTWDARVTAAGEVFGEELLKRPDLFEAVLALDNSAEVYHQLTSDLDKMEEILALPAAKMGIELAKISTKLATPAVRPVSKLPAPIKPLTKPVKGELALDDPNLSQDEFNRRMDAEEEARAARRR